MKSSQLISIFLLFGSVYCFSQDESDVITCPLQKRFIVNGNDTIYTDSNIPAEFPGGHKAMYKYLQENLKYPEIGFCPEGKCYLQFIVDMEGNISNIKVLRGVPDCPECDQEAINVVKGMPKWIPAKVNGRLVKSYFQMPVNFTLN